MPRLILLLSVSLFFAACSNQKHAELSDENLVLAGDPAVSRSIGDETHRFTVLGSRALRSRLSARDAVTFGGDDSLVVGYPLGLLGEQAVFGGVITAVSDTKSEDLGMLKLSDL